MPNITRVYLALVSATLFCSLSGCEAGPLSDDGQQMGNAGMNALQDRSYDGEAERLYVEECAMCHREHGMGTVLLARRTEPGKAMLEARDDLTTEYIIMSAREGIGNMPRMSRGEVSDENLKTIAEYLASGGE